MLFRLGDLRDVLLCACRYAPFEGACVGATLERLHVLSTLATTPPFCGGHADRSARCCCESWTW